MKFISRGVLLTIPKVVQPGTRERLCLTLHGMAGDLELQLFLIERKNTLASGEYTFRRGKEVFIFMLGHIAIGRSARLGGGILVRQGLCLRHALATSKNLYKFIWGSGGVGTGVGGQGGGGNMVLGAPPPGVGGWGGN